VEVRRQEAGVRRRLWSGELGVAAAVEEGGVGCGVHAPTLGGDFDEFAGVVGEVETNGVGVERIAAGGDAAVDWETELAAGGAGFQGADGLTKGVGSGRLLVLLEEGVDEPVANEGRVEGVDLLAEGAEGDAEEGLAGGGDEGGGAVGVVEEELDLGVHSDLVVAGGGRHWIRWIG
jgi:hypothetical protein